MVGKGGRGDPYCHQTLSCLDSVPSLTNFKFLDDKMFNRARKPQSTDQKLHVAMHACHKWNINHERWTGNVAFRAITRGRSLHLVRKCPRKFYCQLAGDGTRISNKVLQHLKEIPELINTNVEAE